MANHILFKGSGVACVEDMDNGAAVKIAWPYDEVLDVEEIKRRLHEEVDRWPKELK